MSGMNHLIQLLETKQILFISEKKKSLESLN